MKNLGDNFASFSCEKELYGKYQLKSCVIKFNNKYIRFNRKLQKVILNNIHYEQFSNIKYILCSPDYHPKVGIHYNLLLATSDIPIWLRLYKNKGESKDKRIFLWMKDCTSVPYWMLYMHRRFGDYLLSVYLNTLPDMPWAIV